MHLFYWSIHLCLIPVRLKRDVVIVEVVACIRIGFIVVTDLCRLPLWRDTAGAFTATAEHVHLVSNNLSDITVLAIIAGELVVTDGALYVALRSLMQIFGGNLAQLSEKLDAVPFGPLLGIALCPCVRCWSLG